MKDFSYITNSHPSFIEGLYQDYLNNTASVDPELKKFFEGFDFAMSQGGGVAVPGAAAAKSTGTNGSTNGSSNGSSAEASPVTATTENGNAAIDWRKEVAAYRLILGYRNKGHLVAKTNPIRTRKDRGANIDLGFYGFTEADLDKTYNAGNLIGLGVTSLRNI